MSLLYYGKKNIQFHFENNDFRKDSIIREEISDEDDNFKDKIIIDFTLILILSLIIFFSGIFGIVLIKKFL